ncbi:low-complexity tail membrane protein [Nodosilinea sp. PGN35]|uniref:low-complexity tail membrane protein n=1 Tax=Nodosilinea sp. PGN35 TaxID=3020489 RepID=UPI0023B2EE23|nr:low-complexity tail membrane protein [Nodosilinea sp. TSF1-S3]MDF0369388.1 low-complexity tail membrane protein [Nodosilinea sp. TSF1-S3]
MAPWRCDPYLWVHLAGLATVPLWLDLCLLGLAVGNPTLPELELGVLIVLGVLPVLAMQLRQPFYIFSLPGLALRPGALQDDQRRLLSQFRRWRVRLGALLVPVPLVWVLLKLYPLAFLARELTPFGDWGRWEGVAIAALSFAMANLFLQIPVAVLQVLATPNRAMASVSPYPTATVAADFTWIGLPVGKILPDLAPRPTADLSAPPSAQGVEIQGSGTAVDAPAVHSGSDGANTEPPLSSGVEAVEPIGGEDLPQAEPSQTVVHDAPGWSEVAPAAVVDGTNPEDAAAPATAEPAADGAVGNYWPLRHPEVNGDSDGVIDPDEADYPQSLPAIATTPNIR